MSIYKNGKLIAGGRQCMPLLSFMWADHVLNDASWLRADTYSWQSGAVYQAAYQHLEDDIDGKTLQSETIDGITIQFYLADDGHKICPASEESNVASIYSATGVAWYYIIDTANTRFKLPRINPDKELLNISAPVITAAEQMNTNGLPTLKFKTTSNGNPGGGGVGIDGSNNFIRTNQSLGSNQGSLVPSNLIANLSNATGLYKGKQYLYFYVGNFTQTALENTAGITTEEMNNKADKDDTVGYCSFNTGTRVQITTIDQTAAKNGWLIGCISFSGSNKSLTIYVNSTLVSRSGWSTGSQWFSASICIPVKAGQTYRFSCDGTVESNQMYFYPND